MASLALDDATVSKTSLEVIVIETSQIIEVSLVGLRFSDEKPNHLTSLLGIETLDNVTVDQTLFDSYADELNAFAAE